MREPNGMNQSTEVAFSPALADDIAQQVQRLVAANARLPAPDIRRVIRLSVGVPAEELAHAVGVTRQTIYRWEAGDREPRGRLRERYAAALRAMQEVA
jgi:DNA-binding XRE family transcriptional regulator